MLKVFDKDTKISKNVKMCASTFVIELAYHFGDRALGYHIAMAMA